MSNLKQEIIFPGSGMNTDDSYEFMPLGDSPYRLNILVSDDGKTGVITNMLGNSRTVDISDHELILSHTYFVLGSYYNRLTRKVYYFVFSQPYELAAGGTTTSTTTTTTYAPWDFDIDYTAGDFEYDNRLVCYNEDAQTLDVIFIDTKNYFGLDPAYCMRDMNMIDGWLYFNPRKSEPKVIDVEMAYNYTNYDKYVATLTYIYGDYVTYFGGLFRANSAVAVGETPVSASTKWDRVRDCYADEVQYGWDSEFRYAFNVIKQPPIYRPTFVYDYDADRPVNNVKDLIFRFAYRYKYFDNSYSVYSSHSDATLPINLEYYNGEIDTVANNLIHVYIVLPSAALVKEIEIVFQTTSENIWRRAKIINRRDITILDSLDEYVFDFYNDESYLIIDPTLVSRVYDSVPRTASCQEIINKNILCYGYCEEGFDNIDKNDIDVTLLPELLSYTVPVTVGIVRRDMIQFEDITYSQRSIAILTDTRSRTTERYAVMDFDSWYAGAGIVANDIYVVMTDAGHRVGLGNNEHTYTIQAADIVNIDSFVTAIGNFIGSNYPDFTVVSNLVNHTIEITFTGRTTKFIESRIYLSGGGANPVLYKRTGFKSGAWHPFCLYYYDGGMRRIDAQTSKANEPGLVAYEIEGTTVYVPMINEISPALPTDTANRWVINWDINHAPPEEAKYWRWGYAGNSLCSWFVQYIIADIDDVTDPANSVEIDITPLQTLKDAGVGQNSFPNSIIDPYDWQKGDRVRFITQTSVPPALGGYVDGVYDFEITKFDSTTNCIYTQHFHHALAGIGHQSLIEIYRPLKTQTETIYYEFGEIYQIVEDGNGAKVHYGEASNQDTVAGTHATGVFDSGDVYHIMRTPSEPVSTTVGYFHESQWWSDFYDSSEYDKGKSGVETTFGERFLNIIRFSNPYFQNTEINGLPTFEPENYKELNDIYGDIVSIYEIGDTLKCYQKRKASSIQLGRTEYMDSEGRLSVPLASVVLGSIRYSPTNFSTVFPESISRNNKFLYGFDIYNGVMWRDSVNGIFPISGRWVEAGVDADYKMAHYFKDKSKQLLVSGIDHCSVMSVWDEEFKNLHVVFKDSVLHDNVETLVFHEPSNRWICFQSLDQTPVLGYNTILELTYDIVKGFEGGLGYDFDEDTRFAIFDLVTAVHMDTDVDLSGSQVLTLTAHSPSSVICSSENNPDGLGLILMPIAPTVEISYVHATIISMTWAGLEYGWSDAKTTVITSGLGTFQVWDIPSWITIECGYVISEEVYLASGSTLTIYPTDANMTGLIRSNNIILLDDRGNIQNILVTQNII